MRCCCPCRCRRDSHSLLPKKKEGGKKRGRGGCYGSLASFVVLHLFLNLARGGSVILFSWVSIFFSGPFGFCETLLLRRGHVLMERNTRLACFPQFFLQNRTD